jgi:hypothetical protein
MLMRASCDAAVCDDRRHICAEPKAASRNTAQFIIPRSTQSSALHSADIGSAFTAPEQPQLVPRTRSSRTRAANPIANFGFKRGTRIIALLVVLDSESRVPLKSG